MGGGIVNTNDVRDVIQGYYGYTTDYYTTGVANTTQFISAGTTTMIEPQVASNGLYQYLPSVMTGVNTTPYVGTGRQRLVLVRQSSRWSRTKFRCSLVL